eukprot:CAMPEP_0172379582 /NCGR_PEP_ID=MMETSP1060-20121228/70002_1 /TAXON_ID=37318 /ORGANISM="Pseudo-nitzschia pungens, Strain cf. cingulata" /LENGTH=499 /DNA_ID=CAMNT_0013107325 /DNA_START=1771 /DNA_END=3270 /DNA_ORIENTATION=+
MDRTTVLLAAARCTSAIARLSLGPLMPMLSASLGFSEESKPLLLSAYSSGYLLTQIGGGYLADKHGYAKIVSATVACSALILFYLSSSSSSSLAATTAVIWIRAMFCLGLVAGPLFPAGSAAISASVPPDKRAASFAIVDASASAGTTVASLAPLVAEYTGWRFVYRFTATCLLLVALGVATTTKTTAAATTTTTTSFSSVPSRENSTAVTSLSLRDSPPASGIRIHSHNTKNAREDRKGSASSSSSENDSQTTTPWVVAILFLPVAVGTYLCHCCDNFTKYSINSWAATMLFNSHNASPALVSTILAGQEAIGVLSKLFVGTVVTVQGSTMSSASLFRKRGTISCAGFVVQGAALWCAFRAKTPQGAGACLVVSAIAAGCHSVGFRPVYLEASPDHSGAISGFGNSIASCASVLGPVLIGSSVYRTKEVRISPPPRRLLGLRYPTKTTRQAATIRTEDWSRVALYMLLTNLCGAVAALWIAYPPRQKRKENQQKEYSV